MQHVSKSGLMALFAAGLALAGCSSDPGSLQPGGTASDKLANMLAFGTPNPPPIVAKVETTKVDCPTIEVQEGTAAARYYAGARTNDRVRYQFSITDVARECTVVGGQIQMKVGVAGRALLGPAGSAGTFSAPVRIAVRKDSFSGGVAASKVVTATATLGSTESADAPFSVVADGISIPFLREQADQDYTVLVGFDTGGAAAKSTVRRKRRH